MRTERSNPPSVDIDLFATERILQSIREDADRLDGASADKRRRTVLMDVLRGAHQETEKWLELAGGRLQKVSGYSGAGGE